jgi:hypothetical protein
VVVVTTRALATLAAAVALAACRPQLDDTESIVGSRRVLAVRADPAEAKPGAAVTWTALVADPSGTLASAPIDWAFCNARKPLAELGPVSAECLQRSADVIVPIGVGTSASAKIPDTACRSFGPATPESKAGEPAGRPVDPDSTGGYYQPLRLVPLDANDYTLERTRIECGLAGATAEESASFAQQYRVNANPAVDSTSIEGGPMLAPDDGAASTTLPAGTAVTLRVAWAVCASDAASCTGAESYALFDLGSRAIVTQREAIRASFFATAGSFAEDRVGRSADETDSFVDDGWTPPPQPGRVHLWVVLRDERGGVGWQSYAVDVR